MERERRFCESVTHAFLNARQNDMSMTGAGVRGRGRALDSVLEMFSAPADEEPDDLYVEHLLQSWFYHRSMSIMTLASLHPLSSKSFLISTSNFFSLLFPGSASTRPVHRVL